MANVSPALTQEARLSSSLLALFSDLLRSKRATESPWSLASVKLLTRCGGTPSGKGKSPISIKLLVYRWRLVITSPSSKVTTSSTSLWPRLMGIGFFLALIIPNSETSHRDYTLRSPAKIWSCWLSIDVDSSEFICAPWIPLVR